MRFKFLKTNITIFLVIKNILTLFNNYNIKDKKDRGLLQFAEELFPKTKMADSFQENHQPFLVKVLKIYEFKNLIITPFVQPKPS